MAKKVMMKNDATGLTKKGFHGFSWTYLFFGWLVPIVRGEIGIGALHLVIAAVTMGISQIIFCFLYNKQYTQRLIEKGYRFADTPEKNAAAAVSVGADLSTAGFAPLAAAA